MSEDVRETIAGKNFEQRQEILNKRLKYYGKKCTYMHKPTKVIRKDKRGNTQEELRSEPCSQNRLKGGKMFCHAHRECEQIWADYTDRIKTELNKRIPESTESPRASYARYDELMRIVVPGVEFFEDTGIWS